MGAEILVGTDFSAGSSLALAEARQLSRSIGVQVVVAHVAPSPSSEDPDLPGSEPEWLAAADLTAESVVRRRGVPAVELARMAREMGALLIVLGTHGASGYQPVALGGTASRMPLLAPCPVVLVGPRGRIRGPGPQAPRRTQRATGLDGSPSEPLARQIPGTVSETQE